MVTRSLLRKISNLPGWRTKRKIVVIESDDWGSIRMPSISCFNKLEKCGIDLRSNDAERYNMNDSLSTSCDLEKLFELLMSFKDKNDKNPVFTACSVVANPDFKKIKESDFTEYFYEPITTTLSKTPGCERSFQLWIEGIEKSIFYPEMHGREHLNISSWLNALKRGESHTIASFNEGFWGFVPRDYPRIDYQAAFLLEKPQDIKVHENILKDGLELFETLFGYKARYFVPPNGQFNNFLNKTLSEKGILLRSAPRIQKETIGNGEHRKRFHYLGQSDRYGIKYITRNCFFEPSQTGKDWVNNCLNDVSTAFKFHKPAVISSHRVNYVGALYPENRDNGLKQLTELLRLMIKNWPELEFMTTSQLGTLMNSD